MSVPSQPTGFRQCATTLVILTLSTLLFGCATPSTRARSAENHTATVAKATPILKPMAAPAQITDSRTSADPTAVVRYGRYTLVELTSSGQEDLMQQIVDIAIPASLPSTVGDALRYVLLRSGYQLCQGNDD